MLLSSLLSSGDFNTKIEMTDCLLRFLPWDGGSFASGDELRGKGEEAICEF